MLDNTAGLVAVHANLELGEKRSKVLHLRENLLPLFPGSMAEVLYVFAGLQRSVAETAELNDVEDDAQCSKRFRRSAMDAG